MSNVEVFGRPEVRIRSIAAWNRLRPNYDTVVKEDGPIAYWTMNEELPYSYDPYDSYVLALSPIAFWQLREETAYPIPPYDTAVAEDTPVANWKFNTEV